MYVFTHALRSARLRGPDPRLPLAGLVLSTVILLLQLAQAGAGLA